MSKAEVRELIAALRPAAAAMDRAIRAGYLSLDEETGWVEASDLMPAEPANPDQLSLA